MQLTHADASLFCQAAGGWLVEPIGPRMEHWLVHRLVELNSKRQIDRAHPAGHQYWIGARDHTFHEDNHPGNWIWEHLNTTVRWFDWGLYEPNNSGAGDQVQFYEGGG